VSKQDILAILRDNQGSLESLKIKSLSVFGSAARDEADPESDIDILVEFSESIGLFHFIRTKRQLEELLGREVDLVTPDALLPELKDNILRDAVRV
jgi:hypothetical protein